MVNRVKGLVLIPGDAVYGAEPEAAFAILQNGDNPIVRQPVFFRECGECVSIISAHAPASSAEPEVAVSILNDRGDCVVCQPVFFCECGECFPVVSGYTVIGSKPEVAFSIQQDLCNMVAGQSVLCLEMRRDLA